MKKYKDFVTEVAEPKGGDEKRFKKMHTDAIDKKDYPIAGQEHVFKGKAKAPARVGDIADEDEDHYDAQYVDNGNQGEVTREGDEKADGVEKRVAKLRNKSMMDEEVELIEAVKPGTVRLKDGNSQKIKKEDASALNALFTELGSANRKKMEARMTASSEGFAEVLNFAKEV